MEELDERDRIVRATSLLSRALPDSEVILLDSSGARISFDPDAARLAFERAHLRAYYGKP